MKHSAEARPARGGSDGEWAKLAFILWIGAGVGWKSLPLILMALMAALYVPDVRQGFAWIGDRTRRLRPRTKRATVADEGVWVAEQPPPGVPPYSSRTYDPDGDELDV